MGKITIFIKKEDNLRQFNQLLYHDISTVCVFNIPKIHGCNFNRLCLYNSKTNVSNILI